MAIHPGISSPELTRYGEKFRRQENEPETSNGNRPHLLSKSHPAAADHSIGSTSA